MARFATTPPLPRRQYQAGRIAYAGMPGWSIYQGNPLPFLPGRASAYPPAPAPFYAPGRNSPWNYGSPIWSTGIKL